MSFSCFLSTNRFHSESESPLLSSTFYTLPNLIYYFLVSHFLFLSSYFSFFLTSLLHILLIGFLSYPFAACGFFTSHLYILLLPYFPILLDLLPPLSLLWFPLSLLSQLFHLLNSQFPFSISLFYLLTPHFLLDLFPSLSIFHTGEIFRLSLFFFPPLFNRLFRVQSFPRGLLCFLRFSSLFLSSFPSNGGTELTAFIHESKVATNTDSSYWQSTLTVETELTLSIDTRSRH